MITVLTLLMLEVITEVCPKQEVKQSPKIILFFCILKPKVIKKRSRLKQFEYWILEL